MAKLIWDDPSERRYYSGVDHGVFYPVAGSGVAWNGLTEVTESSDISAVSQYVDGILRQQVALNDSYSGAIKAYTYPDNLESYFENEGLYLGNQRPKRFNLSYRTFENSDEMIHIIYNAIATPDDSSFEQPVSATEFAWTISTVPVKSSRGAPSAHFIVKPGELREDVRQIFYDQIYGTDEFDPHLPDITSLIEMLEEPVMLRIIDHGDGTWTAIGPDSAITMLDETTFQIDWPSAIFLTTDMYELSDL